MYRRARKAVAAGDFFQLIPLSCIACAVPEVLHDRVLDGDADGSILPAHALTVQRIGGKAELGGGGYRISSADFKKSIVKGFSSTGIFSR